VPTRGVVERRRLEARLAAYLEELRARGASASLLERSRLVLPRLFEHLRRQGVRDVLSVRELHLVRFARHLAETHGGATLSAASRSCYLHVVRGFFAWLVRTGVLLENPARDLPAPHNLSLPRRVLTMAEARRLMDAPPPSTVQGRRDRALLELLYGSGLRRGECLRLDVTDLDLGQALVLVRCGKGSKDRVVPLTARAVSALDRYLRVARPELVKDAREPALFLSKYGLRMSRTCLWTLLGKHAKAAGIDAPVFPHVLRHSCATHLLKAGASIRHVQELLGHESLQATALYTRVTIDDLHDLLARCHPRERERARR
jgi:integrase/recombinase XerD